MRLVLEYGIQFQCPRFKEDIEKLERVKKRATKTIQELERMPCNDSLQQLSLFSLSKRRLRAGLITVYKYRGGEQVLGTKGSLIYLRKAEQEPAVRG